MLRRLALLLLIASPAGAQTAKSVMATAMQKEAARQANIKNYVLIQTVGVMQAPAYYEKASIDGKELFRLVPQAEWEKRRPGGVKNPAEVAEGMATGLDMMNGPLSASMGEYPGGVAMGAYVSNMMTDMATFSRAAAAADRNMGDGRPEAAEAERGRSLFAQRARLVGTEDVDGHPSYHLLADKLQDIPLQQPDGAAKVTMVDANMWLDKTDYVPRRLVMHLLSEHDGRKVPLTIEMQLTDYKSRMGLMVASRQIMRIDGLMESMSMDSKQRKELEKARKDAAKLKAQMADMDKQMAKIPASMRKMMTSQMDKAMKQMEMLANEGAFTAEIQSRIYSVNQGPPFDWIPDTGADS